MVVGWWRRDGVVALAGCRCENNVLTSGIIAIEPLGGIPVCQQLLFVLCQLII